ncbi:DUF86 domain-containing protein [Enterococcus innesii]|uniref:HepT-like ribonuclease domain-containing protein n=1 Tax=Enterococcus innesii TaxID=2839759 RepID=UPI001C1E2398|nr:HepT-like ribonuclease domain-containing protein [Enterococcus innesii]MEB5917761.1 DUF86 domain-containing protein [Enterococcus innesii]
MRNRLESDLFHIEIMIDRFSRIEEYSRRFTKLGIDIRDEMALDSLSFQLDQAGEQLSNGKLSSELKKEFSDVDWREMKSVRNFIAHSYVRKNNAVLMKIIKKDVPKYIDQLYSVRQQLLKQIRNEENEK